MASLKPIVKLPQPSGQGEDAIWSPEINERSKNQRRAVRLPQTDARKPLGSNAKAAFWSDQQSSSSSSLVTSSSTTKNTHSSDNNHHSTFNLPFHNSALRNHKSHIKLSIRGRGISQNRGSEPGIEKSVREKATRQLSGEGLHFTSAIPQQRVSRSITGSIQQS